MSGSKGLFKILATILFVALLAGSAFLSHINANGFNRGTLQTKEQSLEKYGFYLEPDNEDANINFRHLSPQLDPKLKPIEPQIASMGASVSIVDFDNDGWNDIYFTNSRTGSQNALYRNLHNGKFENVAVQMGVADVNKQGTGVSMGAIWADYDNDGYEDLFLYKWGRPQL